MNNNKSNNKYYNQTWFMWLMLLLFFPVGIFLLFKKNNSFSNKTKIIISICAVAFTLSIVILSPSEIQNLETDNDETLQQKEDDNFFITDNNIGNEELSKEDFGINTINELKQLGFDINEASEIYNLFLKFGVNNISDVKIGSGTSIDELMSFVAIANNDSNLKFYFTVENRQLYYAGFLNEDLFDSTKGGVLKSINDVHIPKTEISVSTYAELQVLAENTIKQYLKYPSTAKFPIYDGWGIGRKDDEYQINGKLTAKNGFGVEDDMSFTIWLTNENNKFIVEAIVIDDTRVK